MDNLSEALRLMRVFNDKKLVELAGELEISPSHLSEIEHGKKKPSLDLLERYSSLFKIKLSTIMLFSEQMDTSIKSKVKKQVADKMVMFLRLIEHEAKDL